MILTIPVARCGLFVRERRLLGLLPRCAYETVRCACRELHGTREALPGMVASIQKSGGQLQWNPHVHSLVSDGVFYRGGDFVPGRLCDKTIERLLTETLRRLVLDALGAEGLVTAGRFEEVLEVLELDSAFAPPVLRSAGPRRLGRVDDALEYAQGKRGPCLLRHLEPNEPPSSVEEFGTPVHTLQRTIQTTLSPGSIRRQRL